MKNWKRLLALFLSLAMVLSLCACGSGDNNGESPSPDSSGDVSTDPDASESPEIVADLSQSALEFSAGVSPTDILLTINGEDVQADLFLYFLSMACGQMQQYMSYFGTNLSEQPDMADNLTEQGIEWTISYVLMRQKAAELGCLLTDAQNEEIRQAIEEADMDTQVPYWDLTPESTQFIFELNAYSDNLYDALTHDPSDEELESYLYRVKHILIKTVDDSQQPLEEDVIAEKRAQAEDILSQLQLQSGNLEAKFDELMSQFSEDGRDENGDLYAPDGYLAGPGEMVSEFEDASMALKEGELSGIVESSYGYHIILRLPTNIGSLTDEERTQYTESFRMDAMQDQMDQWIDDANVARSEALSSLNAVEFYTRLSAYQQALYEQANPADSAPVESGGVG